MFGQSDGGLDWAAADPVARPPAATSSALITLLVVKRCGLRFTTAAEGRSLIVGELIEAAGDVRVTGSAVRTPSYAACLIEVEEVAARGVLSRWPLRPGEQLCVYTVTAARQRAYNTFIAPYAGQSAFLERLFADAFERTAITPEVKTVIEIVRQFGQRKA